MPSSKLEGIAAITASMGNLTSENESSQKSF